MRKETLASGKELVNFSLFLLVVHASMLNFFGYKIVFLFDSFIVEKKKQKKNQELQKTAKNSKAKGGLIWLW